MMLSNYQSEEFMLYNLDDKILISMPETYIIERIIVSYSGVLTCGVR